MKKNAILLVIVLVASTLLIGCRPGGDGEGDVVTIRLGVWASSPAETELLDSQIREFHDQNPNIRIERQVITGEYDQQMQANIAARTEPDVYYLDVSLAPGYMERGVILPLNEYLDDEDIQDFEENLIEGFSREGNIYGLPKDYNTLVLFYNRDMFEAAGVEVPRTWQELEDAARALTVGNVRGLSLANDPARFIPFIYQAGGQIVENGNVVFNSPEAVRGVEFYYSLLRNGYADTPQNLGVDWNGSALAEERVAMVIEGGWMIPFMRDAAPDVNYGIAKLPRGDQEGDLAFTVAYVMSRNTKNQEAAAEVIKFLTGTRALELTAESGLAIPSRRSMAEVFTDRFPERSPLVEMVEFSNVYQFGTNGPRILDELTTAGERILLQGANPQEALDRAAEQIE